MDRTRSTVEELAFKTAELDDALRKAGFDLAFADPAASRDFSYRARYLRRKTTLFPRLHANLEYYLATRSFSLKISADCPSAGVEDMSAYSCLVKNYTGSLGDLLERYFDSVRRGVPFMLGEPRK